METPLVCSSSLELDPLLKDLSEKKLSFKRSIVSLASELKDSRRRLAAQEQSFAEESLARKVVETRAKNLEEEIGRLQNCLQDKAISERQQQLEDHQRVDQELKKRVAKLNFYLREAHCQMHKLQRMVDKRDRAINELLDQLAMKKQICNCCKEKQSFWESTGFKIVISISMLFLVAFTKS